MTNEHSFTLLSKKGMKELTKKISDLERRQKDIRGKLRELDRSTSHDERLARIDTLSELESVDDELMIQRSILRTAKPLPSKRARFSVALGSVVDLIDQQGRLFRYTIVDSIEVNPSDGRISAVSPLGSRLLGRQIKDTVELVIGNKTRSLQLVKIT